MFEKHLLVSVCIVLVCVLCFYHGNLKSKSVRGSIALPKAEVQRTSKEAEEVRHREILNDADPASGSMSGRSFHVDSPQWLAQSEENGGGDGNGGGGGGGSYNITPPDWLPGAGGNKTWNHTGLNEPIGHGGTHGLHNVVEPNGVGARCADMWDVEFTTISCNESYLCSQTPIQVTEGVLVCRTLYNMYTGEKTTRTSCISTSRALSSDECGCCGGDCPAMCECSCNLPSGKEGVLVHQGINGTRCAPRKIAMTIIAVMEGSCVTECR
jgi:hypothetical protein